MRNGRDGTAGKLVCDTEGTLLTFLKAWKQLYDAGAVLNVSDGLNNLFLTQQICFLTASTSNLAGLLSQIGGRFELGCAYFPKLTENAKFGAAVSGSALFMFNKKNSAKTAAAWEFVKYMTSASVQARFAAATGYMPVNVTSSAETVYSNYISENPQALVGANQLAETSPDMLSVTVGPSRDFYMEIMNQISSMLTDNKTPEVTVKSNGFVQPYADSPIDDENVGEHVYIQIINNAKDYVYINTPYLVVDENLLSALTLAAKSGVDVRIITPHRWDKWMVAITSRSYYRQLIKAGVKVYEYTQGFNHSKTFVSDDKVATVGTTNLDFRSLYLHFECGVWMYKTRAVMSVKKDFLNTLPICHEINREDCARNAVQRIVQDVLRIFAPLM
jgi:hypothetical protein